MFLRGHWELDFKSRIREEQENWLSKSYLKKRRSFFRLISKDDSFFLKEFFLFIILLVHRPAHAMVGMWAAGGPLTAMDSLIPSRDGLSDG